MAFEITDNILTKYIEEDGVTEITIPEGITGIGDRAFKMCNSLTAVTIPEGVLHIGEAVFLDCKNLTSVTFPKSLYYIGPWAFRDCRSLTAVRIPEGTGRLRILQDAFTECHSLTSVTIPASVTDLGSTLGDDAFHDCAGLAEIQVSEQNPKYRSIDGILYDKQGETLLCCPGGKSSVTIPESVTCIQREAFQKCKLLTSVNIPESVTRIGDRAFQWFDNLADVTIPASVTWFGNSIFYGAGVKKLHLDGKYEITGLFYNPYDMDRAIEMLRKKDFSMKMDIGLKYPFVLACYKAERDPESLAVIRKQLAKYLTFAVKAGDIDAIQALTETDGIFTRRNTDKYIQLAIDVQQHEIFTFLNNYKAEKLGFKDVDKRLKL